jgi:hypothetical protein
MSIRIWEYGISPELLGNNTTGTQLVEGNPFSCSETFLDDAGAPLEPLAGYPLVQILEGTELIVQSIAYIKTQQDNGEWFADLTIPFGLDFSGPEKVLTLQWIFKSTEGTEKNSLQITVLPKTEEVSEDYRELVMLGPVDKISVTVPYILNILAGDIVEFTLFDENSPLVSSIASASSIMGPNTVLEFPVNQVREFIPRLRPYNLVMNCKFNTINRQLFSQIYLVNPSILSAMQALEMSINKANQVETIKGLQFREVDLLQGLTRGLDYFNNVPPSLTSFNGICMTGSIREGWLVCSSIRVLRAQLQAEGWFNFDFSGQNISVSVDRTAAVETAAGHYESLIDSMVRPLKMLLAKKGIIAGDGSVGDRLAAMSSMGVTRLSNTTITRSKMGGYPGTGYNNQ